MPTVPHIEKHFMATETVRDVVIGMADGLTVPFALAAGLSAAVSDTSVIVTAGLAEIAAGAIAMGLGGYLAEANTTQAGPHCLMRYFSWQLEHASTTALACRAIEGASTPFMVASFVASRSSVFAFPAKSSKFRQIADAASVGGCVLPAGNSGMSFVAASWIKAASSETLAKVSLDRKRLLIAFMRLPISTMASIRSLTTPVA